MLGTTYIDENGNRYELIKPAYGSVYFVLRLSANGVSSRFGAISGSRDQDKAAARLDKYAVQTDLVAYPSVICDVCARRAGKTMNPGHIATFYEAQCDICHEIVVCTEPRDYGHWRSQDELKALYRAVYPDISVSELVENTKRYIGVDFA